MSLIQGTTAELLCISLSVSKFSSGYKVISKNNSFQNQVLVSGSCKEVL